MAVISTIVPVPAGVTSSNDVVVPGGQLLVASGGAIVGTIVAQAGFAGISAGGTATGTTVQDNAGPNGGSGGQDVYGVSRFQSEADIQRAALTEPDL